MNRILITGGRGGIGRSLTETLSASSENHVVTLGRSEATEHQRSGAEVTHLRGSILEKGFIEEVLTEHRITHFVHAAGARTAECASDPLSGFETNIMGTDALFRAARECPHLRRAVYFSTAALYGGDLSIPHEDSALAPSSPYAISKAASELAVIGHTREANYATLILRPGFVVGPYSQSSLSAFIQQATEGIEATLTFPDPFFLHWAPDISKMIARFFETEQLDDLEILHPPGKAISLRDLDAAIKDWCREHNHTPIIQIYPEENLLLPRELNLAKLQRILPGIATTPLLDMIRELCSKEPR